VPAWLTAPPRPAPPVLMPPRLAGAVEELRAEGTGQEILLQVRTTLINGQFGLTMTVLWCIFDTIFIVACRSFATRNDQE